MELSELKNAWNNIESPTNTAEQIQSMLLEKKHPVLKKIRIQLTIEIIGWSAFLLCYYTMFDGDRKPVWINIILVISVLLPLIHNLLGYGFAKYLINGNTIKESLERYLAKVKIYVIVSVISRILFISGLLFFFTYGLSLNTHKYLLLIMAVSIFVIQLIFLYTLWMKRIRILHNSLVAFN